MGALLPNRLAGPSLSWLTFSGWGAQGTHPLAIAAKFQGSHAAVFPLPKIRNIVAGAAISRAVGLVITRSAKLFSKHLRIQKSEGSVAAGR